LQERIHLWNKLKLQYETELSAKLPFPIKVTLPNGKIIEGQSWRTTPYDVAKEIRYAKHLMF
jgi:threonyl-tRNA synthetase